MRAFLSWRPLAAAASAIIASTLDAALAQPQPPASPRVLAALFPNAAEGKPIPQLGVYGWQYWSYEEPFINLAKGTPAGYSVRLADSSVMTWAQLWAAGHIDTTTLYPRSLPANALTMLGGIYRLGANTIPTAFSGTYVLEWDGDADLQLQWPNCATPAQLNCQRIINPNRIEATFGPSWSQSSVWEIVRIGPTGVGNIRLYRKENEAALYSGKILNPKFQALARRYKVLRFMEPQNATFARPFRRGDFIASDAASYAVDPFSPTGAPKTVNFATLFKVALEARNAAWVHVAGLPGAPAAFDAITGDVTSDPGPLQQQWLSACKAHLPTILASSDWDHHMDGVVQGLIEADYPRRWTVYLEGWNEIWNTAQPWDRMTFCGKGVAELLGQGQSASYGYGYLTAHAMVAFDAALRRNGRRQAWTMVLAQQAASPFTTQTALAGFGRYFADRGVDSAPWFAHLGVSVQSYYSESMTRDGFIKAASDAEHKALLRAAILADPSAAARARADWIISSGELGSLGWAVARRQSHENLAVAAGAYFLGDFEGESHDRYPFYLLDDPVIINWAEDFIIGPEGERVTKAWVAALVAQNPNAIAANYQGVSPLDPEGDDPGDLRIVEPWFDGYYGERNGRTRGLDDMLRR